MECPSDQQDESPRLAAIALRTASLAHEISTPLGVATTAGSTLSESMRKLVAGGLDDGQLSELLADMAECVLLIDRNIKRAQVLVGALHRAGAALASDRRMRVDLLQVVTDAVGLMTPEIRKRQLEIRISARPGVDLAWEGYPGRLTQVLVNLVQNALRHAYPEGTPGRVDIRLAEFTGEGNEGLSIEFEDYGRGIPDEILPRLYEPYVTSARGQEGSGLGLAISREIVVDGLLGQIDCVTAADRGTRFTIHLPRVAPESAAGVNGERQDGDQRPP